MACQGLSVEWYDSVQCVVRMLSPVQVVVEESACIDHHRDGLDSDHLGLNKYSGPKDRSFVRVSEEIAQICKKAKELLKRRKNSELSSILGQEINH